MNQLDLLVQNYFFLVRAPFATDFMRFVTSVFDVSGPISLARFFLIVFCVMLFIFFIRGVASTFIFVFALAFGALASTTLKYFFDVTRPTGGLINAAGLSFPSYHATIATVFFVMLIYIFRNDLKGTKKILFNTLCVLGLILVSVSRLYLGVHWLSDVLGGIALGLLVSFFSVKFFARMSMGDNNLI